MIKCSTAKQSVGFNFTAPGLKKKIKISRLPPWLKRIRQRRVQSRGLIVCNQLQQKQAFICYKRLYFESEVLSFGLLDKEKYELRERICWWDWYNGLQQNLDLVAPHDGLWTSCYYFSLVVGSFIILSDSHGKSSFWYKSFFFSVNITFFPPKTNNFIIIK